MKRPLSVTIIGVLLIVVGVGGFAFHLHDATPRHALQGENVWILAVELVAIACGIFLLRGKNWARWLAMAWIAFHVVISFFNAWRQVAVHSVILLLFAFCLFQSGANIYFRGGPDAGKPNP